jgi:hypothetical protein
MSVLSNPLVSAAIAGAWAGLVAAVRVDWKAYKAWRDDKTTPSFPFDWKVAARRYAEGVVAGAMAAVGAALVGGATA